MKIPFFGTLALGAGLLAFNLAHAEPALVGHKDLADQKLDDAAVKAVLLGKRITLGSTRVVLIIAKTGDAQENFLKAHLSMTGDQFQNYWRRLFMTGGGTAPKIVPTEADAIKLAAETPGAVVISEGGAAGGLAILAPK